ncbi:MAG: fumarylacetoacetate hydrolase family protein [Proteobacteria bacterium]|nr:fumarylacetoacetate hydrolase family protein [Pseudomonadota bacterium]
MKLATLKNNTPDGQLIVVSRDLTRYVIATGIASNLQSALDRWKDVETELQALSDQLNRGELLETTILDESRCCSPLPRAFQWADGSAYVNHVELVRKARNAEMPSSFWTEPLMYQGGSDSFLAPHGKILLEKESWGIDFEGEVAVITGDVPMGRSAEQGIDDIRLLMLVNDVSLRNLIPGELAKGFGFFQSKPSSSFSPICVTPDELGDAWRGGKVHLPLLVSYNDQPFGCANAGQDMTFNFPKLISHAAKTRHLKAGTIIGSGTVSNKMEGSPGKPISEGGRGYSCIAEIRMIETINSGNPKTDFMRFGDTVRIEMKNAAGNSIFGAINQKLVSYHQK